MEPEETKVEGTPAEETAAPVEAPEVTEEKEEEVAPAA